MKIIKANEPLNFNTNIVRLELRGLEIFALYIRNFNTNIVRLEHRLQSKRGRLALYFNTNIVRLELVIFILPILL